RAATARNIIRSQFPGSVAPAGRHGGMPQGTMARRRIQGDTMKRIVIALVVLIATTAAGLYQAEAQTSAPPATLALRRVVLSQGGVGYFEYEATVSGNAELPLAVRLDQIDDVLKSIIVFDDRGAVGGVRLAGQEPLAQAFRDLTFTREALESPVALL